MVAGAQSQPQTQQQQPLSAEEEALKRNTDCVYFLASPLTCKKGSECEYRHSEYARVNPRDCWYWLNGNCLNPKCSFRHPPLDGLLGPPQAGGAPSTVQAPALPVTPASQNPKQSVLCIYFQKGYCLKGDKCAFSHGPTPATTAKVTQASPAVQVDELSNAKSVFGTIQKCTQEQKIMQVNMVKPFGGHPHANPIKKVEAAAPRNGVSNERNVPAIKSYDDQVTRVKEVSAPVMNGISMTRPNRPHLNVLDDHGFQNGKDTDEFLRESSPGFDVLVEDDVGDQDYFNGEDQYGRSRGHDSRNLNSVEDYDMNPSADYNSAAETDRDRFRDQRGYQSFDHHMQGQYGWEKQHRASAERMAAGPTQFYRRDHRKSNSPDDVSGLDLRHRLSKQRRVDSNGPRSVISRDFDDDDRSYRSSSRRDHHKKPEHENPLSNRLRGRINFPVGSSADDRDSRHERERSRGRLSPNRPQTSTHQGRLRDRLKGRAHDVGGADFSLPRSSLKFKGERDFESKEQSHLGKRKSMGVDGSQQSEGDVSFDGPMPLSEILKRKREAKAAASVGGKAREAKEEGEHSPVLSNNDEPKLFSADEKIEDPHKLSSVAPNPSELGAEDGAIYDETIDDNEIEGEDQGQGEYEYEQEEEDGEYEENAEGEDEYLEDEDDDFAKKIGVVLS